MKLLQDNSERGHDDEEKPNWFAVACLAIFFCSSGVSLLASQLFRDAKLTNGILLAGALVLFLPYAFSTRRFIATKFLTQVRQAMLFVCASAVLTAIVVITEDETSRSTMTVCLLKTGGLCIVGAAISFAAPLFRPREVTYAMVTLIFVELCVITGSFLFLKIDYNANTVGSRTSTIGLIAVACFSPNLLRWMGFIGSMVMSISLQCRTSAVATAASIVIANIEAKSRRARFVVIIGAILMGGMLGIFADDAQRAIKQVARDNLGSNHPVAKFFLDDKNRSKIDSDLLDRTRVWKVAMKRIERRPVLGYGVGTEMKRFRIRSHSAYLSVTIEGGILLLIAWILLYATALIRVLNGSWSEQFADLAAGRALVYLLAYMLLSAMVESSGLGSISSPINVVFLFLLFWTSQWYVPVQPSTDSNALI